MSGYLSNSSVYNVHVENEAIQVLSRFDSDSIIDIIENTMVERRFKPGVSAPNLINAFEQDFKNTLHFYPGDESVIRQKKIDTYNTIIELLCQYNDIEVHLDDNADLYSCCVYLYELFVSKFQDNIVTFFTNYIIKEKNNIYVNMNLEELKKSRDISTLYGKKIYKNSKLAVINANLEYIIRNICVMDFSIENILYTIYEDANLASFLSNIILPKNDIFKSLFVSSLNSMELQMELITRIKLNLHSYSRTEI